MNNNLGNKETMAKNIAFYMDKYGKTRNEMCEALKVPYTTFTDWVKGKKYPRIDKIEMMANYFGISKADLVEDHSSLLGNTEEYFPAHQYKLPVYGVIPAGQPMYAVENIEGYELADVPTPDEYFFLRVKGDSMINARIFDGDLVLVHKQPCANNGQIVVCLVNGDEATLKRFRKLDSAVMLQPENTSYEPIIIPMKDFEGGYAKIIGVVERVMFSV